MPPGSSTAPRWPPGFSPTRRNARPSTPSSIPRIQAEVARRTELLDQAGVRTVLYDAALLIENGLHHAMDGVIVIWVPPDVQRSRLMARDSLSAEEADRRIQAQTPLDDKRAVATWVVDNTGSREQTRAQVVEIWKALGGGAG